MLHEVRVSLRDGFVNLSCEDIDELGGVQTEWKENGAFIFSGGVR
jgi:hypothetical protein